MDMTQQSLIDLDLSASQRLKCAYKVAQQIQESIKELCLTLNNYQK